MNDIERNIEKTAHLVKLTKNRRNNAIFGESDVVIKKLLTLGCTAAFRNPDDGDIITIFARCNSNVYLVNLIEMTSPQPPVKMTDELINKANMVNATPLQVILKTYCGKVNVYNANGKKIEII
jgi:hypothetical protein